MINIWTYLRKRASLFIFVVIVDMCPRLPVITQSQMCLVSCVILPLFFYFFGGFNMIRDIQNGVEKVHTILNFVEENLYLVGKLL